MDRKEHLKSMITNIVHDRTEEATVDFHNYLQTKMQEVVNPTSADDTSNSTEED